MIKLGISLIIIIFNLCSAISIAQESTKPRLTKEQCTQMDTYYRTAMENYVKGDYANAIAQWEQVLKIDIQQLPPQKMITLARVRLKKQLESLYTKAKDELSSGKYTAALEHYTEYLRNDPTDLEMNNLVKKLREISQVRSDASGDTKILQLIRLGINNYLEKSGDVRISLDALRYVEQLARQDQTVPKLRGLIETEYPQIAQLETIDPATPLIEKRLSEALNDIYEGRFQAAIVRCNGVLTLEPNSVLALTRLGSAYYALGQKDKAKECWTKVLSIDPTNADVKKFLKQK